jgi:alpha-tubulin suppressor-like RCC1 family protein
MRRVLVLAWVLALVVGCGQVDLGEGRDAGPNGSAGVSGMGGAGGTAGTTGFAGSAGCVAELDVGFNDACVVRKDGTLWCWGQTGASESDAGVDQLQPQQVTGFGARATSASTNCAVDASGVLWCWGANDHGQLGNGTTDFSATPERVAALGNSVRAVFGDGATHCAIVDDGTLYCWGSNDWGTVGDGTNTDRPVPVQVPGLPGKVAQASVYGSTCAVLSADGAVWCWGENTNALLGVPMTKPMYDMGEGSTPSPARIQSLMGVAQVAEGGAFRCALKKDGSAWCWGDGPFGQLGQGGAPFASPTPLQVAALGSDVARIAVSPANHACAVKQDRTLWCWGLDEYGELGVASPKSGQVDSPVGVTALGAHVVAVGAGAFHTCALTDDGTLWCWGRNDHGQLGNGTTTDSTAPVKVKLACP